MWAAFATGASPHRSRGALPVQAAAPTTSSSTSGASMAADWPVSKLEKRSTSASKRFRICSGVDLTVTPYGSTGPVMPGSARTHATVPVSAWARVTPGATLALTSSVPGV